MLDKIGNALAAIKDAAVENAARSFLDRYLENFGSVTRFEIDSRQKKVVAEVSLKGEAAPVALSAGRYELTETDGQSWITLYEFSASREWVAAALKRYVEGRKIKIPSALKLAL